MVITLSHSTHRAYEFACHSAACRPPGKNGGTGGSTKGGSGTQTNISRRGGLPQVATVRKSGVSHKESARATATPENFPRGDQRKGPPHSQTFISGQQKNSPWNLTVTKGRGKTVVGKGKPVTKDGGFYGAKLIKAKPKVTSTLASRHAAKMAESAIQKAQAIKSDKAAQKRQGTPYPSLGKERKASDTRSAAAKASDKAFEKLGTGSHSWAWTLAHAKKGK